MNQRELDVLNILWKTDEALMATDIVNRQRDLTQSTVTAVLRVLLAENLVEVAGVTHSGRVLSRLYRPTEKSKEVIREWFLQQYSRFKNVIGVEELCADIKKCSETQEV